MMEDIQIKKLKEKIQQLLLITNTVPAFIGYVDRNETYQFVNKTYIDWHGISEANIVNKSIREVMGDETYKILSPDIKKALSGKEIVYENATERNGKTIYIRGQYIPDVDEKGDVQGYIVLGIDVTAQKEAAEQLRQSEERFRTLIEQNADAIQLLTADGHILYSSDSIQRIIGFSPDEIQGLAVPEVVHPDDLPHFLEILGSLLNMPGGQVTAEYRVLHKNGSWIWVEATGVNHLNNPIINAIVGNFRDITKRKESEEILTKRDTEIQLLNEQLEKRVEERTKQLLEANNELKRSNAELQEFAYVASHDLQEPLRKIASFADLLEKNLGNDLSSSAKSYVNSMKKASKRMSTLISDLLAYSRVTTKAQPLKKISMDTVLHDVIDDLQPRIESQDAEITVEKIGTLYADELQMRLLFQNLIVNALKYAKKDIPIKIKVYGRTKDNEVTVFVEDNGIGFDEKYLDRIFTIFQRLHAKHEYEGTGIGLAICKKVADRHQGTITAKSKTGEGATFIVTLPKKPIEIS